MDEGKKAGRKRRKTKHRVRKRTSPEGEEPRSGRTASVEEAASDARSGSEEAHRPTPVRMVMEGTEPERDETVEEVRTVQDPETGKSWSVKVVGRGASGILPVRSIPLMELSFSDASGAGAPTRRVTCHGDGLEGMPDAELVRLLSRSRAVEESPGEGADTPGDVAPPPRKGRRSSEK